MPSQIGGIGLSIGNDIRIGAAIRFSLRKYGKYKYIAITLWGTLKITTRPQ